MINGTLEHGHVHLTIERSDEQLRYLNEANLAKIGRRAKREGGRVIRAGYISNWGSGLIDPLGDGVVDLLNRYLGKAQKISEANGNLLQESVQQ